MLPGTRILFFDLGLTSGERAEIGNWCNVEIRQFHFEKYGPLVANRMQYRWKPLLIAETLRELESFWWMDSSIRWLSGNVSAVYDSIASSTLSPVAMTEITGHSIFAATNPGMYKYFSGVDEDTLKKTEMFGASFVLYVKSAKAQSVLKWLVLCALEEGCMSPPGSLLGCQFEGERYNRYGKCHRFDQSAINLVLLSLFRDPKHYQNTDTTFFANQRSDKGDSTPAIC